MAGSDDTGSVQAEISWSKYGDNEEDLGYINYHLSFADCTRSIDYNISGDSPQERENSMHKVNELISALETFRDHLEEAFELEDYLKEEKKKRRALKIKEDESE